MSKSGQKESGAHRPYQYGPERLTASVFWQAMPRALKDLEKEYRRLAQNLAAVGYISQGSVFERKKGPGSRFQWTWKNKQQKTESLTLNQEQYRWLQQAVANQRKLNKTLAKMRRLSAQIFHFSAAKTNQPK